MPALGDYRTQPALCPDGYRRSPEQDLAHYLEGEYQHGLPMQVTSRRPAATGRQLADREVSRLEVEVAQRYLPYRQKRLIELRYGEDRPVAEVCETLGMSDTTYARERFEALKTMCRWIYEWEGTDHEAGHRRVDL